MALRRALAAAVLAVAVLGCDGDGGGGGGGGGDGTDDTEVGTMDVNEARAEMEDLLTSTAAVLTAAGPAELVSDRGPGFCSSSTTGAVLDTVRLSLGYVVPVAAGAEREVLDEVIAAWEAEGLELDRSSLDRRDAQIRGRRDGASFGVRALAVPDTGQVALTGETDCLDPGTAMPDWQPDWRDVVFDHGAAHEAAAECRAAARRIGELGGRRDGLAAAAVVEWRGRFRDDFDQAFAVQRRWSERLIIQLLAQADRIDAAAAEAARLQAARHRDRDRWDEERRAEEAAADA